MARPYHPPAPFTAPVNGTIEERLTLIAQAINRKADAGVQGPAQHFLALIAPDGSTWRIEISTAGVLTTSVVPRT